MRATLRELETFAIQRGMTEMICGEQNENQYAIDVTGLVSWLPDSFNLYTESLKSSDNSDFAIELTRRHLARFYSDWDADRINDEMISWLDKTGKRLAAQGK